MTRLFLLNLENFIVRGTAVSIEVKPACGIFNSGVRLSGTPINTVSLVRSVSFGVGNFTADAKRIASKYGGQVKHLFTVTSKKK